MLQYNPITMRLLSTKNDKKNEPEIIDAMEIHPDMKFPNVPNLSDVDDVPDVILPEQLDPKETNQAFESQAIER